MEIYFILMMLHGQSLWNDDDLAWTDCENAIGAIDKKKERKQQPMALRKKCLREREKVQGAKYVG